MKKKLIATLLSTIMVVMMLVPSVFASGVVTGVVYSGGTYLSGAYVTLVGTTTGSSAAVYTDANGYYTFGSVVDGSYTLTATAVGYTSSNSITISGGVVSGNTHFGSGWNSNNPSYGLIWTNTDSSGNKHFYYTDTYGVVRYGYQEPNGNYVYTNGGNGYYGNGYYGNGYYANDITITGIDVSGNRYFYYYDGYGNKKYGYIDTNGKYYYDTSTSNTEYTITFQTNGGSTVSNQYYRNGTLFTPPANPTKAGYVFGGWYTDSSLTQIFIEGQVVNTGLNLHARWLESQETYNALHGQGNYNPTPTTPAPAPAPAPAPGYTQVPQTNDSTPIVLAFAFVSIGCALFAINLTSRKNKKNDVK